MVNNNGGSVPMYKLASRRYDELDVGVCAIDCYYGDGVRKYNYKKQSYVFHGHGTIDDELYIIPKNGDKNITVNVYVSPGTIYLEQNNDISIRDIKKTYDYLRGDDKDKYVIRYESGNVMLNTSVCIYLDEYIRNNLDFYNRSPKFINYDEDGEVLYTNINSNSKYNILQNNFIINYNEFFKRYENSSYDEMCDKKMMDYSNKFKKYEDENELRRFLDKIIEYKNNRWRYFDVMDGDLFNGSIDEEINGERDNVISEEISLFNGYLDLFASHPFKDIRDPIYITDFGEYDMKNGGGRNLDDIISILMDYYPNTELEIDIISCQGVYIYGKNNLNDIRNVCQKLNIFDLDFYNNITEEDYGDDKKYGIGRAFTANNPMNFTIDAKHIFPEEVVKKFNKLSKFNGRKNVEKPNRSEKFRIIISEEGYELTGFRTDINTSRHVYSYSSSILNSSIINDYPCNDNGNKNSSLNMYVSEKGKEDERLKSYIKCIRDYRIINSRRITLIMNGKSSYYPIIEYILFNEDKYALSSFMNSFDSNYHIKNLRECLVYWLQRDKCSEKGSIKVCGYKDSDVKPYKWIEEYKESPDSDSRLTNKSMRYSGTLKYKCNSKDFHNIEYDNLIKEYGGDIDIPFISSMDINFNYIEFEEFPTMLSISDTDQNNVERLIELYLNPLYNVSLASYIIPRYIEYNYNYSEKYGHTSYEIDRDMRKIEKRRDITIFYRLVCDNPEISVLKRRKACIPKLDDYDLGSDSNYTSVLNNYTVYDGVSLSITYDNNNKSNIHVGQMTNTSIHNYFIHDLLHYVFSLEFVDNRKDSHYYQYLFPRIACSSANKYFTGNLLDDNKKLCRDNIIKSTLDYVLNSIKIKEFDDKSFIRYYEGNTRILEKFIKKFINMSKDELKFDSDRCMYFFSTTLHYGNIAKYVNKAYPRIFTSKYLSLRKDKDTHEDRSVRINKFNKNVNIFNIIESIENLDKKDDKFQKLVKLVKDVSKAHGLVIKIYHFCNILKAYLNSGNPSKDEREIIIARNLLYNRYYNNGGINNKTRGKINLDSVTDYIIGNYIQKGLKHTQRLLTVNKV